MRLGSNNVWNPTKDDAKFWLGHNSGYTLDGATIEHWANLASYGGRFSQVTESLRPVRQVSEGITGGALFDGTDDYLAGTQFTLTGEFTIGVKLKILDEVANNDVCIGDLTTANNFIRLSRLLSRSDYEDIANDLLVSFGQKINRYGPAYAQNLIAIDFIQGPAYEVIIIGNYNDNAQKILNENNQANKPGNP